MQHPPNIDGRLPRPGTRASALIHGACLAGLALTLLFVGCESSTPGGSEMAITVDPSSATISGGVQAVVLTASSASQEEDLALPLEWSVSNPALGDFINVGGLSAVYQSTTDLGSNAITVRDQRGAEGVAVVYQQTEPAEEEEAGEEGA